MRRGDQVTSGRMPEEWDRDQATLAHGGVAFAKGLGSAGGGGWTSGRRILAFAPGSIDGGQEQSGTPAHSRDLDAVIQARGALRREWKAATGTCQHCAVRLAPHERQSSRESRAQRKTAIARLSRLRCQNRPTRL